MVSRRRPAFFPALLLAVVMAFSSVGLALPAANAVPGTPGPAGPGEIFVDPETSPIVGTPPSGGCGPAVGSHYEIITFRTSSSGDVTLDFAVNASGGTLRATVYQGGFLPSIPVANCYIRTWDINNGAVKSGKVGFNSTELPGLQDQTWVLVLASKNPTDAIVGKATLTAAPRAGMVGSVASVTVDPTPVAITTTALSEATAGKAFRQDVSAVGGTAPYTYTVDGLPAGMVFDESQRAITGSHTAAGSFDVTIKATDALGSVSTRARKLTVVAPVITVAPTALAPATIGQAYSQALTATGGTAPYRYAVEAGTLPAGLTLSSGGQLSGIPTASGPFDVTIQVTDAHGFTASQDYVLNVVAPIIRMDTADLPAMQVSVPVDFALTASNGTAPYTFRLSGSLLPRGLQLSSTGKLTGTPIAEGPYAFAVVVTDSTAGGGPHELVFGYSGTIGLPSVTLGPEKLPNPQLDVPYSATVVASGGTGPPTFSVTAGALPQGLILSGNTGVIGGVPTEHVESTFTIAASVAGDIKATKSYTVQAQIPPLTLTPSLAPIRAMESVNIPLAATGGVAPYTYRVLGSLPAGLSLSETGVLSGIATDPGISNVIVAVTDSRSNSITGTPTTQELSVSVHILPSAITIEPASLPDSQVARSYSQLLVVSGGAGPYNYQISAGSLPAGLALNPSTGVISGTPTAGGSFNFTIKVSDATHYTAEKVYSLFSSSGPLDVDVTRFPALQALEPVSFAFEVSGGIAPYTFSVPQGALPQGLTLSADGVLSGTPTTAGPFSAFIRAIDSRTGDLIPWSQWEWSGIVAAPQLPTLTPGTLQAGVVGTEYKQQFSGHDGVGPYTFSVTPDAMLAGLTLTPDGLLSGTPTAAGFFPFTVTVTDDRGLASSVNYALEIKAAPLVVDPVPPVAPVAGADYSFQIPTSGGTGPFIFAVTSGNLPRGLILDPGTGVISGRPTAVGSFAFTVTVTDGGTVGAPATASSNYTVVVPSVPLSLTGTAPVAQAGEALTVQLQATGGTGPYTYALKPSGGRGMVVPMATAGLPRGMSLSRDGLLSGTPTVAGDFAIAVVVTDAYGSMSDLVVALKVSPAGVTPTEEPTTGSPATAAGEGHLPATGANSTYLLVFGGALALIAGALAMVFVRRKRNN